MEEAVVKYLNVHGLRERSSHADIIQAKEKIALERDLDGIDTSNIIEDGPRSRRKATARWACVAFWHIAQLVVLNPFFGPILAAWMFTLFYIRDFFCRLIEVNDGASEEDDALSTESKETSRENESHSDFVSQADHATAEDSYWPCVAGWFSIKAIGKWFDFLHRDHVMKSDSNSSCSFPCLDNWLISHKFHVSLLDDGPMQACRYI